MDHQTKGRAASRGESDALTSSALALLDACLSTGGLALPYEALPDLRACAQAAERWVPPPTMAEADAALVQEFARRVRLLSRAAGAPD